MNRGVADSIRLGLGKPRLTDKEWAKRLKGRKRRTIPQHIKDQVWRRDGGKCVECGTREFLEFDHIVPFSRGGKETYRNLQLLCRSCNASKGASCEEITEGTEVPHKTKEQANMAALEELANLLGY